MTDPHHHPERFEIQNEPTFRGRRLAWFALLFIGLSAAGIWAVYSQVAGHEIHWDARLLGWQLLLASLALLLVYFAADGLRLWFTLRALGHSIPLTAMARLVFLNIFVSNITPLATGGGVAQVWFMRRRGVPVGTGLTATTIRTALAVLFIFGATPILLVTLPGAEGAAQSDSLVITLSVSVALYLGFFTILVMRSNWLLRPMLGLLKALRGLHLIGPRRHHRWRHRLVRELQRFAHGFVRYFQGRKLDIAASFLFTAIFLLALFSFPALLFWALGYGFDYWLVIGRMVMTTFVMYFSPTPGASGIAEGVFGYFFRDVVTASHLVLVTVAWRALTIYLGMLIGLFVTQREIAATRRDAS
ncbi:flippase-like domain-containing protein [Guyparkeria hydrothermalis]|uniref:lysylphosphatidylglycerol synthase transmembrane domain-containing protein n=1 Tax=Guyparkeria TaxID=2035712 RepID=UPI0010AC7F12|nr:MULTISPECIES: lysylphosphatidylglycerol synthase transmembrane domain-containing protein [Guyparkeria]MCL7751508.1 flippase-like domain-containing protein [Guyparkeria hydrothermalis]TKA90547.1 flippase-like domain-containing protein [Guyparkeria sp. SB14A]